LPGAAGPGLADCAGAAEAEVAGTVEAEGAGVGYALAGGIAGGGSVSGADADGCGAA
jgi:hypothetical protein